MSSRRRLQAVAVFALLASSAMAIDPDRTGIELNDGFPGLSLRVNDETAPPGSIVQIKVDVTEPKPISTGKGKIRVNGLTTIEGIALMNRDQDTYGVALVDGQDLRFFINSPSSAFGTPNDYPIVAVAGKVASNAGIGSTYALQLDPGALNFLNPAGATYPLEIKNGQLTVGHGVVIGDVSPGSSVLHAGDVVHISGTNFDPETRLQLHEASVSQVRYISSSRIDIVLGQITDMHGMRIRARNPDKSESEYFSYERTRSVSTSNDPVLSRTVPLFAPNTYTTATVRMPVIGTKRRRAVGHSGATTLLPEAQSSPLALGFALQNIGTTDVTAAIELLNSRGFAYATNTITIGPGRYLVREIGEQFGTIASPSSIRVTSNAPLQVLGLVADHTADVATAIPPS